MRASVVKWDRLMTCCLDTVFLLHARDQNDLTNTE